MAHHKSAIKRIRQNKTRRERNRYILKSTRTTVKKLRLTTEKSEADKLLPNTISQVDKLAKNGLIHWKKAANLKSSLTRKVNGLAEAGK